MAIESIGRVAATGVEAQQANVGLEDFLNIFLTQLNFQDPLEPVDNREFIAQLAQFSALELGNRSNENMEGLLDVTSVNQAVSLLGKDVQVNNEDGGIVIGTVTALRMQGTTPTLSINTANGPVEGINPSRVTIVK